MKWCAYLVILYVLVNGDCEITDCKKSIDNNDSKKDEIFLKSACKSNLTIDRTKAFRVNGQNESEGSNNGFIKGKRCLKHLKKCVEKDKIYQKSALPVINYVVSRIPPFSLVAIDGVSQKCQESSQKFIEDLYQFKYWALQMYDATAKVPSGLLSGNAIQFGDFDLCMKSNDISSEIYSKYCLANIQFDVPESNYLAAIYNLIHSHGIIRSQLTDSGHRVPRFSSIQWAVCVPHSCTPSDVNIGINNVLKPIFNGTSISYNTLVNSELCTSSKPERFSTSTIIGCIFFLLIILFEGLCTIYDVFQRGNRRDIIVAFSLKNNIRKMFSTSDKNDINAIHVIRFINGLMLLAAHKSMALLFLPYINRTTAAEELGQSWTVLGRAASLYTDPFIMMSGALSAYSLFGKLKRTNKIDIVEEYTSRIIRILPAFVALIAFCTLVLPWINSGPLWHSVITHHSHICKQYWWRNIFFIHNYFGFENMCLTHTHHVGIDTQLFLLSPFLVLLVWKWPRRGLFALCIFGGISTWMRYHSTYQRKLANYVYYGASTEQLFLTADYMYIIPVYRLTVYVMGIILGYLLREPRIIKKVYVHVGNVIALLCFLGSFVLPSFMGRLDYIYNPRDAAWYAAYAPILWCFCFAWFIYITQIGHLNYLNPILQSGLPKFWTKISYAVYLVQFPVYFYNVGTTKHSDELGIIRKNLNFLELFSIIFLSIILTLLFEIPSQNIRDCIFNRKKLLDKTEAEKQKKRL